MIENSSEPTQQKQPPIGIDLGTTFSVVAYVDASGRPMTVPNSSGELLTPSAVTFEEDRLIFGNEAIRSSTLDPESFADCFKLDMGQVFFRRKVSGQSVPPEVLSGFFAPQVKRRCRKSFGVSSKRS